MFEGLIDEAWDVASMHGTDDRTWLSLARERARTHPIDAAAVFLTAAEREIATVQRTGYEAAVEHLETVQRLLREGGRGDEFTIEIARIREAHARKRTLMTLLTAQRW